MQEVAKLDGPVRIEASVHEWSIRVDSIARGVLRQVEHVDKAWSVREVAHLMGEFKLRRRHPRAVWVMQAPCSQEQPPASRSGRVVGRLCPADGVHARAY